MPYYTYTCAKSVDDLHLKINQLVLEGFTPYGTIYQDFEESLFYQTLQKSNTKTPEASYYEFRAEYQEFYEAENKEDEDTQEEKGDKNSDLPHKDIFMQLTARNIETYLGKKEQIESPDEDSGEDLGDYIVVEELSTTDGYKNGRDEDEFNLWRIEKTPTKREELENYIHKCKVLLKKFPEKSTQYELLTRRKINAERKLTNLNDESS